MRTMLLAVLVMAGCGGASVDPCANPPPNTACAALSPSQPPPSRGECPGPADDMGGIGCDPLADNCICGHLLPNGGGASGYCRAGVCIDVDGGSQH